MQVVITIFSNLLNNTVVPRLLIQHSIAEVNKNITGDTGDDDGGDEDDDHRPGRDHEWLEMLSWWLSLSDWAHLDCEDVLIINTIHTSPLSTITTNTSYNYIQHNNWSKPWRNLINLLIKLNLEYIYIERKYNLLFHPFIVCWSVKLMKSFHLWRTLTDGWIHTSSQHSF